MAPFARSVCVFCGSRSGTRVPYADTAADVGRMLAKESWRLVYGAGDIGLMGEVARAAQDSGAQTVGVIPTHLVEREMAKRDVSSFVITSNMHERKTVMFMNSDAIVVLPGGAGTLDEFFEVLTWRQIGLHAKPIFLLNVEGYWTPLVALIEHVIAEGFAGRDIAEAIRLVPDVESLRAGLIAAFA